jgi:hypothetical protein
MKNLIIRKVTLSSTYQPLASAPTRGTFTLRSPSAGSGTIQLRGDIGASDVPFERGAQVFLERVNLADIYAKGGVGDYVIVVGSSP